MSNEETLYARYISGELTEAEIEQLKRTGDWDRLTKLIEITDDFQMPAIGKEEKFAAFKNQNNLHQKHNSNRKFYIRVLQAVAASVILISAYLFLFNNQKTVLESPLAEQVEHIFADETIVRLNAGSSLLYDAESWSTKRDVNLSGEAFFEVKEGYKFTVKTKFGIVEVLGTSFNVRAHNARLDVQCYDGRVHVKKGEHSIVLNAQQAVVFDEKSDPLAYNLKIDTPEWTRGRSKFQNEPIRQVLDELGRQYNIEVIDQNLNMPFTGSFDHNNLELAIQQIARPLGLKHERAQNGKRISFSK